MKTNSNLNEQIQNNVDEDEAIERLFDGMRFDVSTLEPHIVEARLDELALRRRRGKEELAQKSRNAKAQIEAMQAAGKLIVLPTSRNASGLEQFMNEDQTTPILAPAISRIINDEIDPNSDSAQVAIQTRNRLEGDEEYLEALKELDVLRPTEN